MKQFLLGLIGLAALGSASAFAQTYPTAMPSGGAPPAGATVIMEMPPQDCHGGGCGKCNRCEKASCVREEYTKKTPKVCYTCGCEPLCVSFPFGLCGNCCCDQGRCPTARYRKYLIKKVEVIEKPCMHCVPAPCGSCEGGACHH